MPVSQGSAGGIPGMNLRAWAWVKSDGTLLRGSGCTVSKGAAGLYTLTLTAPLAAASALVRVSCVASNNGGVIGRGGGGATSATAIQVSIFNDAAAATDLAFFAEVYE